MAKPDNPFFAKALVNSLWGHFLGRGLYHAEKRGDIHRLDGMGSDECPLFPLHFSLAFRFLPTIYFHAQPSRNPRMCAA